MKSKNIPNKLINIYIYEGRQSRGRPRPIWIQDAKETLDMPIDKVVDLARD
jgi:hypothetical protein